MNGEIFLKIKEIVEFSYKNKLSDFYNKKYEESSFNPNRDLNYFEDVKKIPFLTKKELSEAPKNNLLFSDPSKVVIISTSSGTTGNPLLVYHSNYSGVEFLDEINFNRIMILSNPFRAVHIFMNYSLAIGPSNILVGDIYNLPTSCKIASEFDVDMIHTTPTMAILLKDYIAKEPNLNKKLRTFHLGGEPITSNKKKFIKKIYPDLEDIFLRYSVSEAGGPIASQCKDLARNEDEIFFHPKNSNYFLEIIDPESGNYVNIGERGELVVTNLTNKATPIIRYKTGDLVSFSDKKCSCGVRGNLLQAWGRINHDIVKVGGIVIRSEMLEKPILNLKDTIRDSFDLYIYEELDNDKVQISLNLHVSLRDGIEEDDMIKRIIRDEFLNNFWISSKFNIKKAIEINIVKSFEITFSKFSENLKSRRKIILNNK